MTTNPFPEEAPVIAKAYGLYQLLSGRVVFSRKLMRAAPPS